ncbi:MAG: ribulose-phosphate 3-epimerase [candidate division Zixibacteria bacterium]|nr:ribulose-phosphate 3-epimerase [candidate division Zixibacteria bacterium]
MAKIAPSVLAADFANLGDEIKDSDNCQIDWFHLDIMDGHFVPNISFGPGIVKTIKGLSSTFLDVHLMLSEPEKYFDAFQKAGADCITFHIEIHKDPIKDAEQIKAMGLKAGISLNPDTSIDTVLPYLKYFDLLLVMSVYPGFGGQKFITSVLPKVEAAKKYIDDNGFNTEISVDGGIDDTNINEVVRAGADIVVMGTAFYKSENRIALVEKVKAL